MNGYRGLATIPTEILVDIRQRLQADILSQVDKAVIANSSIWGAVRVADSPQIKRLQRGIIRINVELKRRSLMQHNNSWL